MDTVGRNKERIAAYIRNQLQEDIAVDQMSFKGYIDPFTAGAVHTISSAGGCDSIADSHVTRK